MVSVLDRAIRHYGLTDHWPSAGYILPDGSLLDFSEGGGMGRVQDHRNVGFLLRQTKRDMSGFEVMEKFIHLTGAIRFMPESIGFDIYEPPTSEQIRTMLEIIEDSGRPPIADMQRPDEEKFYREYEDYETREFARDVRSYWR